MVWCSFHLDYLEDDYVASCVTFKFLSTIPLQFLTARLFTYMRLFLYWMVGRCTAMVLYSGGLCGTFLGLSDGVGATPLVVSRAHVGVLRGHRVLGGRLAEVRRPSGYDHS